jgi:hypothetical protein
LSICRSVWWKGVFDERRKLMSRSWACVAQRALQVDGQLRERTTVDVRTFLMLLATINENNAQTREAAVAAPT